MQQRSVRRPAVAGAFYSDDQRVLRADISRYLRDAPGEQVPGQVVGLISPHAGYIYSGGVAAAAYRQLAGAVYDHVVVIAPSHHVYFQGISLYGDGDYLTPLGVVPVADDVVAQLQAENRSCHFMPQAHRQEHALEVQLPFLQVMLPAFTLIPAIMGSQDWETAMMIAETFAKVLAGRRVLLVASSDLSHYHTYDEATVLDGHIIAAVNDNDPRALWQTVKSGSAEACGAGPMIAVMMLAARLGATAARVLQYQNSGDVSGDRGHVVGYMAAALFRQEE
ncbi:MAG: AmmeMemoRadiSam system protein B [Deltaproteobacteria bacterium]|nr:AmmeMemoRadiSam system protein B [Candidatus Anaeroferrophillus wilburensis]MBN2888045.1 AmmeMemoRadiSam system protein B [Deltaproteobacteria bacterium]